MATTSQIKANRKNAKHSTGPTSTAGRATCSQNGLKHGLSTGHLIIPGESEEEFNEMLAGLLAAHQPANITETMLVQDMAKYHWLADRALRMQNFTLDHGGMFPPPPEIALLIRYHTANERAYHRALAALNASRKTRLAEIGSASQKAPTPPPDPLPPNPKTPPSMDTIVQMMRKGFFYNCLTNKYEHVKDRE